uniref:Uncharacterized protein n=1 Tax=Brassica oleracea TaxID=3712 RepID=A0A3P6EDC1_BRAOL|nr:unnamed protein product [Brassica oleracea]
MILLDENVISSTYDCYIRILRPPDCVNFWYVLLLQSTLIQGTIHSILSGVISVKVLCIRLVDLRSHGATIISHSLTPQSPFVSTIERPSQKRQT